MIHSTLMNEQYSHQIENFKNTVDVRVLFCKLNDAPVVTLNDAITV